MSATPPENFDDLPSEINFSGGTRGKFYRPNARINLPLYLDPDVQAYLAALAARKGVTPSELANELLRRAIAVLDVAK